MIQYDEFIKYGKLEHAEQFARLQEKCKEVAYIASIFARTLFKEQLTTVSIYRKKTKDSGIHEYYRAIDFAPLKSIVETYAIINKVNEIYEYDPDSKEELRRLLKVAHENPYHGTGLHIHIQVCDGTKAVSNIKIMEFIKKANHDAKNFQAISLGKGG